MGIRSEFRMGHYSLDNDHREGAPRMTAVYYSNDQHELYEHYTCNLKYVRIYKV